MFSPRVAAIVGSFLLSFNAAAAEVTRIASSFDDDNAFGMFIDVGYERIQHQATLMRESAQGDQPAAQYLQTENRLKLDVRIGLWQDLEFHFGLPLMLNQNRRWRTPSGVDTSSLNASCVGADGHSLDPNCTQTGAGTQLVGYVPSDGYRGGLGNLTFGLAYAMLNQDRDNSKPMWLLGIDYEAPTADKLDSSVPTSGANRGPIGDRVHKYTFFTALSRRQGILDPYFKAQYTLPVKAGGAYSNCDHPSPTSLGYPQNCSPLVFPSGQTGMQPPHRAAVLIGTELVVDEKVKEHQKVSFDLRGEARYISSGRYYNEASDLLGKLLATEAYLQFGGQLGLNVQAAEFAIFHATASLLYSTAHGLTGEAYGNSQNPNPNFDARVDSPGNRLRLVDSYVLVLGADMTFSF